MISMQIVDVKMTKKDFEALIKVLWTHERGKYFIGERWIGGQGRLIYPSKAHIPEEVIQYDDLDPEKVIDLRLHSKPMPQFDLQDGIQWR